MVHLGLSRGAGLLTAGELRLARMIAALEGPAGVVYARLCGRVRAVYAVDRLTVPGVEDLAPAVDALVAAGLAHRVVLSRERALASTRARLAEVCRARGLPTGGRKEALVERVAGIPGWDDGPWVRIVGRTLVRRLERFALLSAWPDRGTWVAARIGIVRWPTYALTSGPGLHRDRRALGAWEALLAPLDAEVALDALAKGAGRAPGRLDLTRGLVEIVRDEARSRERHAPAEAAALYARLVDTGTIRLGACAVRWARALERAGDARGALAVLQRARGDALPSEQVAIGRSGRRVARALRAGFPPARPPEGARERQITMEPAEPARGKPRWVTPDGPRGVEAAVVALLAAAGRTAQVAEGAPWSTLFALLFADVYFLPVPGALPVPFLSGPLDLGRPGFAAARAEACAEVLAAVEDGRAASLVREAWPRWAGTRLRGGRWDRVDEALVTALAEGTPPRALRAVLEVLLQRGPGGSAGLPDLVVHPGPLATLPDAFPRRVDPGLLLVEVKGPGDTLRDEQIVWHDRLARAGAPVEIWWIRAR